MACLLILRPSKEGHLAVCHEGYNRIRRDGQAAKTPALIKGKGCYKKSDGKIRGTITKQVREFRTEERQVLWERQKQSTRL